MVLVFCCCENREKYPIYASKNMKKNMLMEEGKRYYALIKDFNTFMYDDALYRKRKRFCCYCFEAFRTAEKSKCYIKNCFEIYGK